MFDCVNGGSNLLSFSFFLFPPRENSDQPSPVSAFCNRDGLITFPRSQQKDRTPQLCPLVVQQQQQQQQHTKESKLTGVAQSQTHRHTRRRCFLSSRLCLWCTRVWGLLFFFMYVRPALTTDRPTAGATPVKKKVVHILPP